MSHHIELGALVEKLFLLEHLVHGSAGYCQSHGIDTFESTGYLEPMSPTYLTKMVASNLALDLAIRMRVVIEYAYTLNRARAKELERKATLALVIARDTDGSSALDFRESLNKIIHADLVAIDLAPAPDDLSDVHYWDGHIEVSGTNRSKAWRYKVDVASWCKASRRLINALAAEQLLYGMGLNFSLT
jgi:hypothetical protein